MAAELKSNKAFELNHFIVINSVSTQLFFCFNTHPPKLSEIIPATNCLMLQEVSKPFKNLSFYYRVCFRAWISCNHLTNNTFCNTQLCLMRGKTKPEIQRYNRKQSKANPPASWQIHPNLNHIEMLWRDLKQAVYAKKPINILQLMEFCMDQS